MSPATDDDSGPTLPHDGDDPATAESVPGASSRPWSAPDEPASATATPDRPASTPPSSDVDHSSTVSPVTPDPWAVADTPTVEEPRMVRDRLFVPSSDFGAPGAGDATDVPLAPASPRAWPSTEPPVGPTPPPPIGAVPGPPAWSGSRPQSPAASSWPSSVRAPASLPGYPVAPPAGQPGHPQPGIPGPAFGGDPQQRLPSQPGPPPKAKAGMGSLLLAAFIGALVAAVVSAGVFVWLDGDEATEVAGGIENAPARVEGEALNIQEILTRAQPSVVSIRTDQTLSRGVFGGAGSGVVITDDGLILTNAHVIAGATSASITFFDGEVRDARLVGSLPEDDIALMQVDGDESFVAAELGSSTDIRVGDDVVAIGNALNLGGPPSVTQGIVSAKERTIQAPGDLTLRNLIQTDAAINPGNSGGPLLNAFGEVVGINTAIIPDAQSIGFAIAIDAVRPLIDELREGRGAITLDTAFLGVTMISVDDLLPDARREYGVSTDDGAFITDVVPDSSAGDAGLRLGDVVLEIDGEVVSSSSDVSEAVRIRSAGDQMEMLLERDGQQVEVDISLRSRRDSGN